MRQFVLLLSIVGILGVVSGQGYRSGPGSNVADVSNVVGSPRRPIGTQLTPTSGTRTNYGQHGNAIVTGNVAAGRYFRGEVPYGSVGEFNSSLIDSGSQQVSSFIRRSAGSLYSNAPSGGTSPYYYDPRRAVASAQRGSQSGLNGRISSRFGEAQQPIRPDSQRESLRFSRDPFSMSAPGLKRMGVERMVAEQMEQRDAVIQYDISLRQQYLLRQRQAEESDEVPTTQRIDGRADNLLEPVKPAMPLEPPELSDARKKQVERIERELMSVLFEDDKEMTERSDGTDGSTEPTGPDRLDRLDGLAGLGDEFRPGATGSERTGIGDGTGTVDSSPGKGVSSVFRFDDEDAAGWRARAKVVLGSHESFENLAAAKVAGYKTQAQQYMEQGRFYKADDNYRLVLVWNSEDAAAMFGRVMALFGAGSYMSGAFCAQELLVNSPEYALAGKKPAEILGGRDLLEDRMIELKDWQEKSSSEHLAFLMAYISYLDGKIENAGTALEAALAKMADSPAYNVLKQAVEAGK